MGRVLFYIIFGSIGALVRFLLYAILRLFNPKKEKISYMEFLLGKEKGDYILDEKGNAIINVVIGIISFFGMSMIIGKLIK